MVPKEQWGWEQTKLAFLVMHEYPYDTKHFGAIWSIFVDYDFKYISESFCGFLLFLMDL